jgi:hypothetical protein
MESVRATDHTLGITPKLGNSYIVQHHRTWAKSARTDTQTGSAQPTEATGLRLAKALHRCPYAPQRESWISQGLAASIFLENKVASSCEKGDYNTSLPPSLPLQVSKRSSTPPHHHLPADACPWLISRKQQAAHSTKLSLSGDSMDPKAPPVPVQLQLQAKHSTPCTPEPWHGIGIAQRTRQHAWVPKFLISLFEQKAQNDILNTIETVNMC